MQGDKRFIPKIWDARVLSIVLHSYATLRRVDESGLVTQTAAKGREGHVGRALRPRGR